MFRSSWYLFLLSINLLQAQSFIIKSNSSKETSLQANMGLDMKTIQYNENKSGEDFTSVLQMSNQPIPKAKPGIAVVKVMAAASNPIDFKVMGGFLTGAGWSMPFPFVVGYDFSGVIYDISSEDAEAFPKDTNVFGVQWGQGKHDEDGQPVGGAFAEYIAVPVSRLSVKPDAISHELAAASALVGTTAHQIVNQCVKVQKDEKVLILGGATSVGMIAVQLALQNGAKVWTTASPRNKEFVESLGDVIIINYRQDKWWEMDDVQNVDAVIDTTGEEGGWEHAQKVLKADGSFVSIAAFDVGFDPSAHAPKKYAAFHCLANDPVVQNEIAQALANGKLKIPLVEPFYSFTEQDAKDMLAAQAKGAHTGKLVMSISN